LVDDEGPDQSTELDQRVPVTAVTRQSRRLNCEHGAHAGFADRSQQALEARPSGAATRAAKIIVGDLDCGPAELTGAIGETILPAPALMIVRQLIGRRLSDVDIRTARKMLRRDLAHRRSPLLPAQSRSRAAGLPPEQPDRPSVRPPTRRGAPRPPRTGFVGGFWIGASLSASSVFDSDWRKPKSASISARRDRVGHGDAPVLSEVANSSSSRQDVPSCYRV